MHRVRWDDEPGEQVAPGVLRQTLTMENLTLARFTLSAGVGVPRHAHHNEQVTTVVSGSLRFLLGDEEIVLSAGDCLAVPADVPHGSTALEDSVAVEVFAPRREDWLGGAAEPPR